MPQYREIAGYKGYRVGDDGSVWSCKRKGNVGNRFAGEWHEIKQHLASHGYMTVAFSMGRSSVWHNRYVHELVLEAFVGPRPPGAHCCHGDGNRRNNNLSNLRWGTPTENQADRRRHGTDGIGSRHPAAGFTEADVVAMRRMRAAGRLLSEIAAIYRTDASRVCAICKGRSWKHVPIEGASK